MWMAIAGVAVAVSLALLPAPAAAAALDARIDAVVRGSGVAATSSVFVWDQGSREVLYSRAANRPVAPASTMKLLTSAAALARFGPDHRFSTTIALDGTQEGERFVGDVWLIGGGDPSLSTFGFARDNYGGHGANLAALVNPLRARGIRGITGRIMVDDDHLDELRWVPEWKPIFRFDEAGALGALTVNQSLVGKYVGSKSSRQPDLRTGQVFRELLRRQGIYVAGATVAGSAPPAATTVGAVASPPLEQLLRHMNAASDNFYAEILLKDIGVDRFGARADGSTTQGRRAARAELERLNVDLDAVTWIDGSGLDYGNRATARSLGHVLGVGAQADWGETWISGFASAGRSGTLRRRMTRRPFSGRVFAKTGTLDHSSALAGFAHRLGSNRRFGFAVITSNPIGTYVPYSRARRLQDRVAMVLVR